MRGLRIISLLLSAFLTVVTVIACADSKGILSDITTTAADTEQFPHWVISGLRMNA